MRRQIRYLQLYCHGHYCDPEGVVSFIASILEGLGHLHGYHVMFERYHLIGLSAHKTNGERCTDKHGSHRRRRLQRQHYSMPGPNYLWHMNSYDKLMPYVIAINGYIVGFLRHIIWTQAYFTNNNLQARYYFHDTAARRGCLQIVRVDFGTENIHLNRLQEFLYEDCTGIVCGPCVLQGTSPANYRIES